MTLEVWRPRAIRRSFDELNDMQNQIDHLFERMMGMEAPRRVLLRMPPDSMGWMPAIDAIEKNDTYVVRAELPGMKLEDIDISMSGDTLTIKGERMSPEEIKEEENAREEICYGKFSRSIRFSKPVDVDKVKASYENGMLEIRLPKAAEVKAARIEIKARAKV